MGLMVSRAPRRDREWLADNDLYPRANNRCTSSPDPPDMRRLAHFLTFSVVDERDGYELLPVPHQLKTKES